MLLKIYRISLKNSGWGQLTWLHTQRTGEDKVEKFHLTNVESSQVYKANNSKSQKAGRTWSEYPVWLGCWPRVYPLLPKTLSYSYKALMLKGRTSSKVFCPLLRQKIFPKDFLCYQVNWGFPVLPRIQFGANVTARTILGDFTSPVTSGFEWEAGTLTEPYLCWPKPEG